MRHLLIAPLSPLPATNLVIEVTSKDGDNLIVEPRKERLLGQRLERLRGCIP